MRFGLDVVSLRASREELFDSVQIEDLEVHDVLGLDLLQPTSCKGPGKKVENITAVYTLAEDIGRGVRSSHRIVDDLAAERRHPAKKRCAFYGHLVDSWPPKGEVVMRDVLPALASS